jgi:Phosphomannose isomerase
MDLVKLTGATKDYIWGGDKLKSWGKKALTPTIAESWELSFNEDGPSLIASGPFAGKALKDVATRNDIGSVPASFRFFPVLIKLIDAAENLSVQVHPSDAYALAHEGQYGKTEMWYVIEAKPHAGLYVGFRRAVSEDEVRQAIQQDTVMDLLSFYEVRPGDVFFIPAGTVHAIGKGVTLLEIQQNSTLTYRLYDFGRLGKDGQPRPLHVEKALQVLNFQPYQAPRFKKPLLGRSAYFSSSLHVLNGEETLVSDSLSFKSLTFVSPSEGDFGGLPFQEGDTFFLPASKKAVMKGRGVYVLTEVRKW